jgi:hypothetical protein
MRCSEDAGVRHVRPVRSPFHHHLSFGSSENTVTAACNCLA